MNKDNLVTFGSISIKKIPSEPSIHVKVWVRSGTQNFNEDRKIQFGRKMEIS